jgi:hypothetical protein
MIAMASWRRTTACERAGQWISLDLDGVLGRLERDGLARHLGRCDRCRSLAGEIRGFTELLREAPAVGRPLRAYTTAEPSRRGNLARRLAATGALASMIAAAATALYLPRPNAGWVSTPVFESMQQQVDFARVQHARIEPHADSWAEQLPLRVPGFHALD